MKILVFSDSHRNIEPMITAVREEKPDTVIHLGDVESDAMALRRSFSGLTIFSVPGNCDFLPFGPRHIIINLGGKTIFATHGHTYAVKRDYAALINAAMISQADILLFGHTHQAVEIMSEGLHIINPGSIGMQSKTYGVITIENGSVVYENKMI